MKSNGADQKFSVDIDSLYLTREHLGFYILCILNFKVLRGYENSVSWLEKFS